MTHWAATYLGEPWVAGSADCWAFARRVWREQFGRDVPAIPFDGRACTVVDRFTRDPELAAWHPVAVPIEGDAVLMRRQRPCHVGVWVELPEGGAVLHSLDGVGVVITPRARLVDLRYRLAGFYRRSACS